MQEIYQPEQDSYLLKKSLIKYLKNKSKSFKILDMGSGSGIQALTCRELGFKNILTADINLDAVKHLKKQKLTAIKSNLFSNLKNKKFDLIIFNPPYLPESKYDKQLDTTSGKKGYETITKFLKQAKKHLNKQGSILLLFSSFSQPKIILQRAEKLEYDIKLLDKNRIFFEELFVYELK